MHPHQADGLYHGQPIIFGTISSHGYLHVPVLYDKLVDKMPNPLAPGASVQVGTHIIQREGPITRVIMTGPITVEHVQRFLAEYQAMIDEQGFVLIMMDMREGGDMAMPARRLASEWGSKRGHCVRSAVFGAPFFIRNAIELLNRAARVMTGNAPKITFVRTYEEARDWLLAQVPQLPSERSSVETNRKSTP